MPKMEIAAMTTNVTVNELANLPHYHGQVLLRAARDDLKVEIQRVARTYFVYAFACHDGSPVYTRLAAERSTLQQARHLAARA
jgi:hypothetical protein